MLPSSHFDFTQLCDLVLQYNEIEMVQFCWCVNITHTFVNVYVHVASVCVCTFATIPALGAPCWWRPVGPTSAHHWWETCRKTRSLRLTSLIFHPLTPWHLFPSSYPIFLSRFFNPRSPLSHFTQHCASCSVFSSLSLYRSWAPKLYSDIFFFFNLMKPLRKKKKDLNMALKTKTASRITESRWPQM